MTPYIGLMYGVYFRLTMKITVITLIILIVMNVLSKRIFRSRHFQNCRKAKKISKRIQYISEPGAVINYLRKIDPFVFEELLLNAFKKRGFKVYRNRRYTGDGGIDGKVKREGQLYFIQAKRYSDYINMQHVKDFHEVCQKAGVNGFFIHTGKTGKETKEIAMTMPELLIISGDNLIYLLRD